MSFNVTDINEISKWSSPRVLQYFTKLSQYMYKCNICTKTYKTPNGGVQNLRSHLITEAKKGRDTNEKKRKLQPTLQNMNTKKIILEKLNYGKYT